MLPWDCCQGLVLKDPYLMIEILNVPQERCRCRKSCRGSQQGNMFRQKCTTSLPLHCPPPPNPGLTSNFSPFPEIFTCGHCGDFRTTKDKELFLCRVTPAEDLSECQATVLTWGRQADDQPNSDPSRNLHSQKSPSFFRFLEAEAGAPKSPVQPGTRALG